jgi:hypothetical protein
MDDQEKYPNGQYLWQDANDDQTVQADEVVAMPRWGHNPSFTWLDKDLTVWFSTGHRQPAQTVRMDLGYIFGNAQGTRTAARAYAKNTSFTANVVNDIPHESRLQPQHWGQAVVE